MKLERGVKSKGGAGVFGAQGYIHDAWDIHGCDRWVMNEAADGADKAMREMV